MGKDRGSITVFSLISLLLITATLFALLEGTRLQEIRRFTKLQTEGALESAFSNYNVGLWENYHLLGADVNTVEKILQETANGRVGGNRNLLSFQTKNLQIEEYTLLTDGQGAEFIHGVSSYMKDNLLYETAKEIYNQYEVIKNLLNTSEVDLSKIDEALIEIETATQETESAMQEIGATSVGMSKKVAQEIQLDIGELLEEAQKWKENGVLELVIKDTSKLSNVENDFSKGLLVRQLNTGNDLVAEDVGWVERILLQQYLLTYMSNFRETQDGRALSYEVEYLLGRAASDKENLKHVVSKMFAIREAANFLYLISDPVKNQQVEVLAMTLGGPTLNPVIIKVIKLGLLTAWALAESILDIRALLEGKKIPLLKSEETWTIELENIKNITKEFSMAKESKWGISYENYLGILLLFEEEKSLAMHAMNAQEASIRKNENVSFEMDSLVTQASVQICYSYAPVFPFLQVINAEKRWKYEISTHSEYGYYH